MKKTLITALALLVTASVMACPMCQGKSEGNVITAYKAVTAFLALLPIIGGCSIFYWIFKRNRETN